jgi:hypothetical protein
LQQQGQKIYTITPQNASTALAKLPTGGNLGQEIRNAVQAGKEMKSVILAILPAIFGVTLFSAAGGACNAKYRIPLAFSYNIGDSYE